MVEIKVAEGIPTDFSGRDPQWWIDQILNDLFFLCSIVLRHGKTVEYRDLNWVHCELCDFLTPEKNPMKQLMVLMSRDMLKSSIGRGMMIQWFLRKAYHRDQGKSFIFSGVFDLARDHLERIVKEITTNQLIQAFFAGYIPSRKEDFAACSFEDGKLRYHPRGKTTDIEIDAGSPDKSLTGRHYELGMVDNLANELNTETVEQRKKTNRRWQQLESVFAENSREVIFETTWYPDDVAGIILDPSGGFDYREIRRKPCRRFISKTGYAVFSCPAAYGPGEIGTPVFPEKIDEEYLRRKKAKQGLYIYSALYELQPIPSEEVIIRPDWWQTRYSQLPPNFVRNICVDAAGVREKTKSQSALSIGDWDEEGNLFIPYASKRRMSPVELERWILEMVRECEEEKRPVTWVGIEKEKYGIYMKDALSVKAPNLTVILWDNRNKPRPVRHEELIPMLENRKIRLADGLPELSEELRTYYKGKEFNVDIIDTLWGHLQLRMLPKKAPMILDQRKHQIEKEIEEFERQSRGGVPLSDPFFRRSFRRF